MLRQLPRAVQVEGQQKPKLSEHKQISRDNLAARPFILASLLGRHFWQRSGMDG